MIEKIWRIVPHCKLQDKSFDLLSHTSLPITWLVLEFRIEKIIKQFCLLYHKSILAASSNTLSDKLTILRGTRDTPAGYQGHTCGVPVTHLRGTRDTPAGYQAPISVNSVDFDKKKMGCI